MAKRKKAEEGCCTETTCCCVMTSVVSIDDRGQILLPKDVRQKAGLKSGDKLAMVTWEQDKKVHCIALFKADELSGMIKGFLGPMMKDMM